MTNCLGLQSVTGQARLAPQNVGRIGHHREARTWILIKAMGDAENRAVSRRALTRIPLSARVRHTAPTMPTATPFHSARNVRD